jgi:hypothetical protein
VRKPEPDSSAELAPAAEIGVPADVALAAQRRRIHILAAVLFAVGVLIGFYGLVLADSAELLRFLDQRAAAPAPPPKTKKTPPKTPSTPKPATPKDKPVQDPKPAGNPETPAPPPAPPAPPANAEKS